jgi:hypothetical protein
MKLLLFTAVTLALLCSAGTADLQAEGLPVARYLEDPEHKNDIFGFYLNAVFSGFNLVNERIEPPLFCMTQETPEPAYSLIDRRIKKMQAEKRLREDTTVDSIMLDILMEEYPCASTP